MLALAMFQVVKSLRRAAGGRARHKWRICSEGGLLNLRLFNAVHFPDLNTSSNRVKQEGPNFARH